MWKKAGDGLFKDAEHDLWLAVHADGTSWLFPANHLSANDVNDLVRSARWIVEDHQNAKA
jgi:hypothetical protein